MGLQTMFDVVELCVSAVAISSICTVAGTLAWLWKQGGA